MKKVKIIIFTLFLFFVFTGVNAQFYYFSTIPSNNGYQQGCSEILEINFDTKTKKTVGGIFHLILDNSKIDYVTGGNLSTNLFLGSTLGFTDWVPTFPKRKEGSNYTILETERYNASNPTLPISGNRLYGQIKFTPKYNPLTYTATFAMYYISGSNFTTETTLSYDGVDIIDPAQQQIYLVKDVFIEQKPCLNDTAIPTIVDNNYTHGATKVTNVGLNIDLKDPTSQGSVPYVWRNGSWTGNTWSINNQYGINTGSLLITVSGNNQTKILNSSDFVWTSLGIKTWQDLERDYHASTGSNSLFNFGIEKEITINYQIKDRVGNTKTQKISFNKAKNPWITSVLPANNESNVLFDSNISFKILDDWAGVDSDSVFVVLSGLGNDYYHIYSGGNLSFMAVSGVANTDDFIVTLPSHHEFPSLSNISINIYAYDFSENGGLLYSGNFRTKATCVDLGCSDIVYLSTGYDLNFITYLNSNLSVLGGKNPYLEIIDNTGYINCNLQNEYLTIYKGDSIDGTGTFVGLSSFENLEINGTNIKARLSGNTLYLEKIVDSGGGTGDNGGTGSGSNSGGGTGDNGGTGSGSNSGGGTGDNGGTGSGSNSGGGSSGGGGGRLYKDNCCINGGLPGSNYECIDYSDSYYDGSCEGGGFHGSADICGVNQSKYSNELKGAYLYSYTYGITTMCPIWDADLDGYLYRNHFAKMISEYSVNVLGRKPNVGKAGCDQFQDIADDTEELKYFMKTACEFELMGMRADGKTPKTNFDPHDIVTRAEFGTVFSRLLFGEKYNIADESLVYKNEGYWYKDHLNALKNHNIMTKIDGDWPNYLERRGWVMLMLLRADKYGIFAGKIPALMSSKVLFE